jgi:hypothetical protein
MENNTSINQENGNDANRLLADIFLPTLDKKNFRQWMLGMMMQELEVPFKDMPKLLKLQKCTQEIIRFAEEHNLLAKNLR